MTAVVLNGDQVRLMLVSLTSWKVRSGSCGTPGRGERTGVGGREGKTTKKTPKTNKRGKEGVGCKGWKETGGVVRASRKTVDFQ